MKGIIRSSLRSIVQRLLWSEICQISDLKSNFSTLEDELNLLKIKSSALSPSIDESLVFRKNTDDFIYDEIFVIGSGPSLLDLTQEEKNYISSKTSVAMNRYILYWDLIGIWPQFIFMADAIGIGKKAFKQVELKLLNTEKKLPIFILENYFKSFVHPNLLSIFFIRDTSKGENLKWANSLNENIFYRRGSLTCLLNVLAILRIAPVIKLIGIDLNRGGTFFDSELNRYPELINPWDQEAKAKNVHATVGEVYGWKGSMLDHWPDLNKNLVNAGIKVYCCNRDSLLVQSDLSEYRPIIT
ncbi:hypothetical protein LYNGBM3L_50360 [Moorena producens 3L]|uniref:DUF115 domain-containing protein n=2 Tax=Coleofasciculaceae TaxID=1892251 RepID=F4XY80_9CYAN|nr:hypothetical protein LYNGBM3L_50360 [Moorena producens 3L]NEP66997.1 hypothetical protein [Moorena sp. SIO3A5]